MSSYEMVFQKLREDILNGHYQPQEELRETAVGRALGVSRTPVREALRQLELEGLVTIIPNKGAVVNGISEQDIQDIYLIRARLEGLCARMAAERIDPAKLEELEEVVMLTRFHEEKGHADQLVRLDSRFHNLLYESCKSKILEKELKDFHQYIRRVRKHAWAKERRAQQSTLEHAAVLDAIKARDPQKADRLATLHIVNSIKNNHYTQVEKLLANDTGQKETAVQNAVKKRNSSDTLNCYKKQQND